MRLLPELLVDNLSALKHQLEFFDDGHSAQDFDLCLFNIHLNNGLQNVHELVLGENVLEYLLLYVYNIYELQQMLPLIDILLPVNDLAIFIFGLIELPVQFDFLLGVVFVDQFAKQMLVHVDLSKFIRGEPLQVFPLQYLYKIYYVLVIFLLVDFQLLLNFSTLGPEIALDLAEWQVESHLGADCVAELLRCNKLYVVRPFRCKGIQNVNFGPRKPVFLFKV